MPDQEQKPSRHHLLIAGTGRAGTSFLVRWLAAAGLRTHLSAHDTPMWDDDANAGLEDLPVVSDWETAPYVMKSPWLVEVIDEVLANQRMVLDGVIIPMRDLTEAAASRVVQELQNVHRRNPWMTSLGRSFEQWGTTPGGVVYSLDPVDQARLLAVSFHRLLHRLVQADIPVVLLDFPRLALDADYLFAKLRRFVPATIAEARAAHAQLADPDKIRVGRELSALQAAAAPDPACQVQDQLDAAALRREVRRLTGELAGAERTAAAHQAAANDLHSALETQAVELAGLAPPLEVAGADPEAARAQVAALIATIEHRRAAAEQTAAAQQDAIAGLRGALDTQAAELAGLVTMLEAREASQAQLATLTAAAERGQTEAERAKADHQAVVADLRSALDVRAAELAGQAATLAARDAALEAAQALLATQTATAEHWRTAAERATAEQQAAQAQLASLAATAEQSRTVAEQAAAEQQEVIAGLRSALDARAGELAGLAANLEARDADLAATLMRVATLTTLAEQRRTEAEHAATAQQDVVDGLRNALDARTAELAGLTTTLAAHNADLTAAQAQVAGLRSALDGRSGELAELTATLEARNADLTAAQVRIDTGTALAEQRRAEVEDATAAHQAERAGLRSALEDRAADLAALTATLAACNAELDAALVQIATLTAAAEQRRLETEHATADHNALVADLRTALDARTAELSGSTTALAARDTDLQAAHARIAALSAAAEQLRNERDAMAASWSWRAGQPLRLAGRSAQGTLATLRPGRPPIP
jgi:hypothetical protein